MRGECALRHHGGVVIGSRGRTRFQCQVRRRHVQLLRHHGGEGRVHTLTHFSARGDDCDRAILRDLEIGVEDRLTRIRAQWIIHLAPDGPDAKGNPAYGRRPQAEEGAANDLACCRSAISCHLQDPIPAAALIAALMRG